MAFIVLNYTSAAKGIQQSSDVSAEKSRELLAVYLSNGNLTIVNVGQTQKPSTVVELFIADNSSGKLGQVVYSQTVSISLGFLEQVTVSLNRTVGDNQAAFVVTAYGNTFYASSSGGASAITLAFSESGIDQVLPYTILTVNGQDYTVEQVMAGVAVSPSETQAFNFASAIVDDSGRVYRYRGTI